MRQYTFTEDQAYEIFLALDDRARQLPNPSADLLALRERFLLVYQTRHPLQPANM
jgi:hypothetical protein